VNLAQVGLVQADPSRPSWRAALFNLGVRELGDMEGIVVPPYIANNVTGARTHKGGEDVDAE